MHRAIEWIEAYAKILFDGVQLPVTAGSNPAVRRKTYRRWIGLSFGTQKRYAKVRFRVRERFFRKLLSFGQGWESPAFLSEPCKGGSA